MSICPKTRIKVATDRPDSSRKTRPIAAMSDDSVSELSSLVRSLVSARQQLVFGQLLQHVGEPLVVECLDHLVSAFGG